MKLSVSIPDSDVVALDAYVRAAKLPSRSAGIQQAVRRLVDADLEAEYAQAWDEWVASGDAESWEGAAGDGLDDATR